MEPHDCTSNTKLQCERSSSPVPSCVSMKTDRSLPLPPAFNTGPVTPDPKLQCERSSSPVPSCVSMKTDRSLPLPPAFNTGPVTPDPKLQCERSSSPVPSCVSMKTDRSLPLPPAFNTGPVTPDPKQQCERSSPVPSCVSMKTDRSLPLPPAFNTGPVTPDPKLYSTKAALHISTEVERSRDLHHDVLQPVDDVLFRVIERHKTSMKNKHESLFEGAKTQEDKTLLNSVHTQLHIIEGESEGVNEEHEVLHVEKRLKKQNLQDTPINCSDIFQPAQGREGETKEENIRDVKNEDEGVEVPKLRTVLTKGIAGIGKTVSVQKFILDWAEGKANQDVDFMFMFPFRELNLIMHNPYSLHELLGYFHPDCRDLDPNIYVECKVVFIFDGLDESRIPLDFSQCEKLSDITMTSSVSMLMSNLITGELLPSALIWITSRPAAANQIPPQYINRVTEIQGFNDPQKEEYFRKRISDQDQAEKIISHIKTTRSLRIMCHIPVFCWISATVLQQIMKQANHKEIPRTLTEMYTHLLLTQTNMKNEKYEGKDETDLKKLLESNRAMIIRLAELAFKQQTVGNIMFYEEDLRECGIDVNEASVYSGICTEIFREESVLDQRKVFCFVHLSFQEFLAAFYLFYCYVNKDMKGLQFVLQEDSESSDSAPSEDSDGSEVKGQSLEVTLEELLKKTVCKAVRSQNGHLDLFLRFLLGISLESNQRLLQGLLTQTHSNPQSINKIIKYIQKQIQGEDEMQLMRRLKSSKKQNRKRQILPTEKSIKRQMQTGSLPTDRSINLFLCLSEMKDQSLSREIREYLNSAEQSEMKLSAGHCAAIAYMLQMSEEVLDELELKKFNTTNEGYRRLIPGVSNCRKALIIGCNLNTESAETLSTALQTANCSLSVLDLSGNDLQDSGVKLLSHGLMSSQCKLEILRLASCNLTMNSTEPITSVLNSANSYLKELDLSNNNLQDSGVKLLSEGLHSSHCKLGTLKMAMCNLGGKTCECLGSALQANSPLKELDLSNNDLHDSGINLLSDGLKTAGCKLEFLRLSGCLVTEEGCSSLASALSSNPSHLKELDLTYNHPGESGVKLLSARLEDPHCKLETLKMEHAGTNRIKAGLRKYGCELTLDPNTAHAHLSLSEDNKKVTFVRQKLLYPKHSERFDDWEQVLSKQSLSGRCYWEAEWSGGVPEIAVAYHETNRKQGPNEHSRFGFNKTSWSLFCFSGCCSAWHNQKNTDIPASLYNKVGVYLDCLAGTLSFYSISADTHTLTHLHTFYSTFTGPLYAGFGVRDASLCVCQID
ncbi:NACHT, LRR and PYD domains-containing protein 3-like [Brachyhypopomus gauderio]|uniref:NACHT, LRR and PYD domains-containing protein 3-like n=1 Tax=Brachyhypopomus gauderio TaxID=698409 RepID=UPI004040FB0A